MKTLAAIVLGSVCGLACVPAAAREKIVGGPCQGCDLVFVGRPASIGAQARIAPATEPGQALTIEGTVRDASGQPAAGIIVYAYHTDASGRYPKGDTVHGRLRGWARTDARGGYRFDTIRPAAYPGLTEPQHVHLHVIEPGRVTYTIDSLEFRDDPRLTETLVARRPGRGGTGVQAPGGDATQGWTVRRDIELGRNIPGYPVR